MLQVALNVHLETDNIREEIFRLPFEIKNHVKRFKTQLRELMGQSNSFNVVNDYLDKPEFNASVSDMAEEYANHLDKQISGLNQRPETSELIVDAIRHTPEHKVQQFIQFLSQLTQAQSTGYVPSTVREQSQVVKTNAKLFVPNWVKSVDSQRVLAQMLYTSGLNASDISVVPNLNNYLDLVNVYHLNMKTWPAINHLAHQYLEQLKQYDDIKRAYFQWHTEYRLVDWLEYALIDPELDLETIRNVIIKAYARSWLDIELRGTQIRLHSPRLNRELTQGFVPLATVLETIAIGDVLSLQKQLLQVEKSSDEHERLEWLLHQLKQAFFELDEGEDEEQEWLAAGLFVAWQRTTQNLLKQLS